LIRAIKKNRLFRESRVGVGMTLFSRLDILTELNANPKIRNQYKIFLDAVKIILKDELKDCYHVTLINVPIRLKGHPFGYLDIYSGKRINNEYGSEFELNRLILE
jgi:hypothetical protein